jgi:hypothetical protein
VEVPKEAVEILREVKFSGSVIGYLDSIIEGSLGLFKARLLNSNGLIYYHG